MKSFLVGLGVGVGLGVLFAPGRGEDTRRELGKRLNSVAEDAQRQAQELAQRVRDGLDKEPGSDSDDLIGALRPRKDQARESAQPATSSTEGTDIVNR